MSYIKQILNENEAALMLVRLHWVYLVNATLWLVFFVALGGLIDYLLITYAESVPDFYTIYPDLPVIRHIPVSPFALLSILAGIWLFADLFIKYYFSEIALTKKRVIYKHGMIHVELEETDLQEIKAEDINHGLFGYFVGYGRVKLDSRFVNDMELPAIHHPIKFIKNLQHARSAREDTLEKELHIK